MRYAIRCVIGLTLFGVILINLDLGMLAESFRRISWATAGAALGLFVVSCGVAVAKWRLLWHRASWMHMLSANFVAQFYSLALPGQIAGEIVKSLRLGARFSDTTNVAASVIVDRATGLLGLLILGAVGASLSVRAIASEAVVVLLVSVAGVLVVLLAIAYRPFFAASSSLISRFGERVPLFEPLSRRSLELMKAWASLLGKPIVTGASILMGVVFQAVCIAVNIVVARGLGIDLSFADWCWVFSAVTVAVLLPVTVGGIGIREGVYVVLLGRLGVSSEQAVTMSMTVFGVSFIGVLIGAALEGAYHLRVREQPID